MIERGTIEDSTTIGPPPFVLPEATTLSAGQISNVLKRPINISPAQSTSSIRAFLNSTSVGGDLGAQRYAVIRVRLTESRKTFYLKQKGMHVSLSRTDVHAHTSKQSVLLTSEDGRYILRRPVTLNVSDADQDGIYVVTDDFSTVYGSGNSPAEAIDDYGMNLFTEYDEFEKDEEILGVSLQRELASLRQHIVRN